jgi:hypothetical protein
MGSTKHIRNNGEHLNIHGHDNYQMPGAYKQMGDMNQNQPGKISGGAAKYIKEAYGATKADYDKDMAEERIQIKDDKEKIYQDDKEKKESYGADKIGDPETDPSQPTPAETAKSINKFSKSVYDAGYNATKGTGGHSNIEYEKTGKDLGFTLSQKSPGLPQGVFQDYSNSGGNKSPRVAKDILTKAANFASSETGNPGFRKKGAGGFMNRSYYAPSEGFSGVDTQTGKTKRFSSHGANPEVAKHSDAFQKNMRFGIDLTNKGSVSEIKNQGTNTSVSIKSDLSGLKSKKVIKNTNPNTKNTKKERYQEVKSIFKSNRRKSKRNSK